MNKIENLQGFEIHGRNSLNSKHSNFIQIKAQKQISLSKTLEKDKANLDNRRTFDIEEALNEQFNARNY